MTALPAMHEAHQRLRDSNVAESHVNKPLGRGSTRMMTITAFEDRPPESAQLTAYDERHFATYLRLLDADEEGADWRRRSESSSAWIQIANRNAPASSMTVISRGRAG